MGHIKEYTECNDHPDHEWFRGIQQQDEQVLEDLWCNTYVFAYGAGRKFRQYEEFIDDVAFCAYKRANKYINSYKFKSKFKWWVYRIVANCAIDIWKKIPIDPMDIDPIDEIIPGTTPITDDQMDDALEKLRKCIETLSGREKEVVHFLYLEELTPDEVAQKLGITRNNVNRVSFSARKKIRSCMDV